MKNIEINQVFPVGNTPYAKDEYKNIFKTRCFFVSDYLRKSGNFDYTPIFFNDVPNYLSNSKIDVALIQITPPNNDGYCSLGISCGESIAGIKSAKVVIGMINPSMPFVMGDGLLHISNIDYCCNFDYKLPEIKENISNEISDKISTHIAENLIEDGCTLQIGIGAIPESVLKKIDCYKDLGVHTELFGDGVVELAKKGVINGKRKTVDQGLITSTFSLGTKSLYEYINNNPTIAMRDVSKTNDPFIIGKNYKMVAINSGIEIDLTGQIVSDSIGRRIYSGFGGQVDFIYGTSRCPDGKAIIALPSSTKGISRIVPTIKEGAGVVTTRANARYVVTEYGIVNLFGKTLRERAKLLISIAHPDFRKELYDSAQKLLNLKL